MKRIERDIFGNEYEFVDIMESIYEASSDNNFANTLRENKGNRFFSHYLDLVNKNIFNQELNVENYELPLIDLCNPQHNKIILLFSGGKDSCASALKLRELGYDVTLFFVNGINLGYSNEKDYAIDFARENKFGLIVKDVYITGTQEFLENPTKNQLILSYALEYGIQFGIYKYSYGGFISSIIEECSKDRNFSDCVECFRAFALDIEKILPEFEIITLFKDEVESLMYLSDKKVKFLSCITPIRYRKYLHDSNEEKYNVKLRDENCGSCWKCCLEYIVNVDTGIEQYNKSFYHHCLDVMRKKVPEERPYLTEINSLFDVYACNKYYHDLDSKFFKQENGIRLATLNDFESIKELWKTEVDVLGHMFYSTVKDEILNGDMYVCERDNNVVAFCGLIRYAKTNKIEIDGLVVDKAYRKKGIALLLINKLLEYNVPVYAQAVLGAENNNFYNKIGVVCNRYTSKSGKLELVDYEIVKEKVNEIIFK